jgi:hypothetical protein
MWLFSSNLQPLFDVPLGLVGVQRAKLSPNRNSLLELPKFNGVQFLVKFGLPNQHDLQQLVIGRLKV